MALPLFPPERDPGPDFVGLLRLTVGPGRRRPRAWLDAAARRSQAPHGTTVVALRYADGVVMAGDRRATAGNIIAHHAMEKVFPADRYSAVAIAGTAGHGDRDGPALPGPARALREGRGRRPSRSRARPTSWPRWCASTCRWPCRASPSSRSSPASTRPGAPGRIFNYDVTGGHYEDTDFQATGSGGRDARSTIKLGWREGLARDEAVDLAIQSLYDAADEDSATGGPDLVRGIYPIVAVVDADGYREVPEDEVAERFAALIARKQAERAP